MFVPLHTKSEHSLGYGTAPVDELLRTAAGYGYAALGVCDIENLYGQIKLHHAARARGVKAITGVELRAEFGPHALGRKQGRLVLLARDWNGYQSLCRIITQRRGQARCDDPLECLKAGPRGLFYLSDDAAVLQRLADAGVAPSDLRFLLVPPGRESAPDGIRAVASTDAVMAHRGDWPLHALQTAIRLRRKLAPATESRAEHRYLAPPGMMQGLFADAPEALNETLRLAEACSLDLTTVKPPLPDFSTSSGEDAAAYLERICRQRFARGRQGGQWSACGYEPRLNHELAVLGRMGLAGYLLTVLEIADHARDAGMMLAGRGSAASSLVLHVLGVTGVDPLRHGLHFERFVNAGRGEPPDVDLDVPSDRRDELIAWVIDRFGPDRVAMVSTHQTFGWRVAFREGLKSLGMGPTGVDEFCRALQDGETDAREVRDLATRLLAKPYRDAVPLISRLVGRPQHIAVHPGGIVIARPRVDCYAPLELAPKGVAVTQYDMHALSKLGMIKIDLLGNRALAAISETLDLVGESREIPDHDPATVAALQNADTIGCFQIETPTLRAALRKLPIRGIADVMAALAIVRPGPASGQAKAAFIRRAHGQESCTAPHERLTDVLRGTHGMMLYEEDVMSAIGVLTGWSLQRADRIRAAVIREQDDVGAMARLQREFVDAAALTGVAVHEATQVWHDLRRFAMYSFNKAHAASYARLAWQTGYLKTHYPAAFACAVLNHYGGCYPLRTLVGDFARHGVRFLAPHVNHSGERCMLEDGDVRIGLSSIKHLSMQSRRQIREQRPFHDFADFLHRTALPARQIEALVLGGACDGLAPLTARAYPVAHEELLAHLGGRRDPQALHGCVARYPAGPHAQTYASLVRVRNEAALLGMCLHAHPMQILRQEAQRNGCVTIAELWGWIDREVQIATVVAATRRVRTGDGATMQYATFEDETGVVEAVLAPAAYAWLNNPLTNPGPFFVAGRMVDDYGDRHMMVTEVCPFHLRPRAYEDGVTAAAAVAGE